MLLHFFCEARLSFSFFSFHHPLLNHLFIILLHVSREWSALILEFLFLLFYYPKEFAVNSPQRRRFQTIRVRKVVVAVDNLHVNGPLLTSLASMAALAFCIVQSSQTVLCGHRPGPAGNFAVSCSASPDAFSAKVVVVPLLFSFPFPFFFLSPGSPVDDCGEIWFPFDVNDNDGRSLAVGCCCIYSLWLQSSIGKKRGSTLSGSEERFTRSMRQPLPFLIQSVPIDLPVVHHHHHHTTPSFCGKSFQARNISVPSVC